ncbi:ATP-binding_protein [Hexamita inflata]|uniref:GPN-loop GTPase 3 n=1 Tax=Hexamita inflata TaxID=28002 RepID=A0ABP1GEP7_9EUKA
MKYAVFITGAAGSAKSTTTHLLHEHYQVIHRRCTIFNLDPACDYLPYEPAIDIRDLVTAQEVQDFVQLGPNGALIYAFQHFFKNEREFLAENLDYEDDFLIFDCPGQIELYVQNDDLQRFAAQLQRKGYECCCLYLIDATKLTEKKSILTNLLISQCVQMNMRLPFILVASKCDLVDENEIQDLLEDDCLDNEFYSELNALIKAQGLTEINYLRWDSEEAAGMLQGEIDHAFHYGE